MSVSTVPESGSATPYGIWLVGLAAVIGLIVSLIAYFTPHGPIAQSGGALLVIISTALMLMAALLIAFTDIPRWLVTTFVVLIILGVLGTGVAAYFLEANLLLALMVVALIGWIIHLAFDPARIAHS